jgi:hypothetical protein
MPNLLLVVQNLLYCSDLGSIGRDHTNIISGQFLGQSISIIVHTYDLRMITYWIVDQNIQDD